MATPATKIGKENQLKSPNFTIGQKVVPDDRHGQWLRDFPYFRKQYALHLIKSFRENQRGIHQYLKMPKKGGRIPEGNKNKIRECLRVFSEARRFEVAGIVFDHGFNLDSCDFNSCYLSGVEGASSPPSYTIQLLIRFEKEGNELALVVGCGISSEHIKAEEELNYE